MKEWSGKHPRYGYRRITALLRADGWPVNRKRVGRLWRQEGLKVPVKQRKRRRLGCSEHSCTRRRAEYRNHVWSYDFVTDRTEDGRRLKLLVVVDEFTRESLSIEVARHLRAEDVIETLAYLFAVRGAPRYLRSDNGPEFVAEAIQSWLASQGSATLVVAPGSPWENAYIESFNSRLRDELLNGESFACLKEAQVLVEAYRGQYNHYRPHSSLGYLTPAAFAATCIPSASATPALQEYTSSQVDNPLLTVGT
jgi:putative transposase